MTPHVLIVSDDEANEALRQGLVANEFKVAVAADAEDGYRHLLKTRFDVVVVNLAEAAAATALIKRIRSNADLGRVKVLTIAEWGTGQATTALSHGADRFEPKPIGSPRLVEAVQKLLRSGRAMIPRASTNRETQK